MKDLCVRYSQASSCEKSRLGGVISNYAAAKARRLDRIAREFGGLYDSGFFSVKAEDYAFDSWYGGEIHIFLPSDPDIVVSVPFDAFNPGYEAAYREEIESDMAIDETERDLAAAAIDEIMALEDARESESAAADQGGRFFPSEETIAKFEAGEGGPYEKLLAALEDHVSGKAAMTDDDFAYAKMTIDIDGEYATYGADAERRGWTSYDEWKAANGKWLEAYDRLRRLYEEASAKR